MISYELAKELKDAGFPQLENKLITGEPKTGYYCLPDLVYIPSLSELIHACGDDFGGIRKKGDRWNAGMGYQDMFKGGEWGKTPSEAVAKLWLAVNK